MEMWQPGEVEEALEQCLARVRRGESAQACLASYPDLADELGPLMAIAQELRTRAGERPVATSPALAAGRERFLQQAAELRARRRRAAVVARLRQFPQALAALLTLLLRRGMASTMAAIALVVLLLAGTTTMASANSLPGDPLYPVKRVAESVQLALTFSQADRAQVQQTLDRRRIDETRAVLELHKVTRVSFRGAVESLADSTLVAAGFTVQIVPTTRMLGATPRAGQVVSVIALSREDGVLVAETVTTLAATPPPASPTPPATATAPGPTRVEATTVSTKAATMAIGNRPTDTRRPTATVTADPTLTQLPPFTLTCTVTPSATPILQPTVTVTPQAPRPVEIRFEGMITSKGASKWQVAGRDVRVTAETLLDERIARAEIGAWVRVRGYCDADGTIVARGIVVERGAANPGELIEFQGLILAITGTRWTVGEQAIEITPATIITGEAHIGWLAEVRALRRPEGNVEAIAILIRAPQEIPVEFVGIISELADDHWLVGGYTVRIDAQTTVEGTGAPGELAEVQGLELADGSVRALRIRVRESVSPSPTASPSEEVATLTATPSPSTTPILAEGTAPDATPTETPPADGQAALAPPATATVMPTTEL